MSSITNLPFWNEKGPLEQRNDCLDVIDHLPWAYLAGSDIYGLAELEGELPTIMAVHVYGTDEISSGELVPNALGLVNLHAAVTYARQLSSRPTVIIAGDHRDEREGVRICEIYEKALRSMFDEALLFGVVEYRPEFVTETNPTRSGAHDTVGEIDFLRQNMTSTEQRAVSILVAPHRPYAQEIITAMGLEGQITAISAEGILLRYNPQFYWNIVLSGTYPSYLQDMWGFHNGVQNVLNGIRGIRFIFGRSVELAMFEAISVASTRFPKIKRELSNIKNGIKS